MPPELDLGVHRMPPIRVRIARSVLAREVVEITVPDSAGVEAALEFVRAAIRAGQPLAWVLDMSVTVRGVALEPLGDPAPSAIAPVAKPISAGNLVHFLQAGGPICGFVRFIKDMPDGHKWSSDIERVTCQGCRSSAEDEIPF